LDDDTVRVHFSEGKIGFVFSGSYNVGVWYDQFPSKVAWDVAPFPVRDANNYYNSFATVQSPFLVSPKAKTAGILTQVGEAIRIIAGDNLRAAAFTAGKDIPFVSRVATSAKASDRPQWNSFANANLNSVVRPIYPDAIFAIEGNDIYTVFSQLVLGMGTPAAALDDLEKRYNAAFDRAVSSGSIDRNDFIDPSVPAKFKAGL
jgi:multiple sugar transport system substrate-binding protein